MFQLLGERGSASPDAETPIRHAYLVNSRCFATSGDLQLWHRRLRHMDPERLLQIFKKRNLAAGFKLTGRVITTCDCETCRQAKIKRWSMPSEHPFEGVPDCIGHTVHSDVKVLPFASFRGYKYVINFIDSHSRLGFCYFLRSKTEVVAAFRQYIADMRRFGFEFKTFVQTVALSISSRAPHCLIVSASFISSALCAKKMVLCTSFVQLRCKRKLRRFGFAFTSWPLMPCCWMHVCRLPFGPMLWFIRCTVVIAFQVYTSVERLLHGSYSQGSGHVGTSSGCLVAMSSHKYLITRWRKVPGLPKGRKLITLDLKMVGAVSTFLIPSLVGTTILGRIDALRHHDQRRDLL